MEGKLLAESKIAQLQQEIAQLQQDVERLKCVDQSEFQTIMSPGMYIVDNF